MTINKWMFFLKYLAPIVSGMGNICLIFSLVIKQIAPINAPIMLGIIGAILFYPTVFDLLVRKFQTTSYDKMRINRSITLTLMIGALGTCFWMLLSLSDYGIHQEIFTISSIQIIQMLVVAFINWKLDN